MPGEQGTQVVEPCAAHEPATQGMHEGADAHAQLPPAPVREIEEKGVVPAEPAAHEKSMVLAPVTGTKNGTIYEPGKAAADGKASAATSAAASVRL